MSTLDGMAPVEQMVAQVARFGQPALALTDHGNLSGAITLYRECKRHNILAMPGEEFYLVDDVTDKKAQRYHVGITALTLDGYRTLIGLSSRSHLRERFHRKPLIDFTDLADLAEAGLTDDLVLTTGCYFGLMIQTLIGKGQRAARHVAERYAQWFPNTYIEVQQHNTTHDDEWTDISIAEELWEIAQHTGLPMVVTQDSHYCSLRDRTVHTMMKRLTIHSAEADEVGFPGDSYHLASGSWVKKHYQDTPTMKKIWSESLGSLSTILEDHTFHLPAIDNYKFKVPIVSKAPNKVLRRMCETALLGWESTEPEPECGWQTYHDRLDFELSVIKKTEFANYFLLVADIAEHCRDEGILYNVRGSANGSLVCYLAGITGLDPIRWDLLFERFLTLDRAKPPDIDIDVDDARREEVLDWIAKRHPVTSISTYSTLGADPTGKGSIVQSYMQRRRRELGDGFADRYGGRPQLMETIASVDPDDAVDLQKLADMRVKRQPGTHAAAVVLGTDVQPISDYMPTMLIPSSNHTVTQPTMDDVEDLGYVKLDWLGLRALRTISYALIELGYEAAGKTLPELMSFASLDDRKVFAFLRRGIKNTGVFQLEGWTMARGCREIGVKSVDDLVVVNALYRPATINAGHTNTYLYNRQRPHAVTYFHDIFEHNLSHTFGVPVYQEQVMGILRDLGFPPLELNKMLKAIKASNDKVEAAQETFLALRTEFLDRCDQEGMTQQVAIQAWGFISTFSDYSFNRAHATAYGLLGYYMGYLKVRHPLEFHAALLASTAESDKNPAYISETRRCGIRLLPPDVNVSGPLWTLDRKRQGIRKGLLSIKGLGPKAAVDVAENRPYADLEDLIARTTPRSVTGGKQYLKTGELNGKLAVLKQNNALISIGVTRDA